ncbi:phage terminase large subunit family protein [Brevibacillus sp. JB24b]|uniref:phage terminase large subunit family protein n=1 Tax=Brevibacillus sp. JB24b TaxID=3422308 RepID=UPI003F685C41
MIPKKTFNLFNVIAKLWAPPPDLTVSQWADANRRLSPEASAEPGRWNTDRAPYQREIMDAINDPYVTEIVVKSSAQVGKSELILNSLGYFIDHDPSPVILLQPTLEMAQSFSKDRLAPMLRDSPTLKNKVKDVKSRDSGNTQLHKRFPGGQIILVGANSPAGLASRPIRIVLCDEVDRYPASAGTEGDPVKLVTNRTKNFWNRKHIYVSTPTIKNASRIEALYENSTMEQWCLACPSCKTYQPLSWGQITFDYDEKFKKATNVLHACIDCGSLHNEVEWKNQNGKWIARQKGLDRRGFHLNELSSPWSSWESIVKNFKEANEALKKGDHEQLKTWVNTSLGETWEEKGEQMEADILLKRREIYSAEVPEGVKVLTAAVDTQDNRFEIDVIGWGVGYESWRIQYHRIYGDLNQPQVWDDLDEFLLKTWTDLKGNKFPLAIVCMDSGGHFTNEVYRFCKERAGRRVFAIKGEDSGDGTYKPLINGTSENNRYKTTVVRLGVSEGKNKVLNYLEIEAGNPGYCHFPEAVQGKERPWNYNKEYFEGLTAESKKIRYKNGVPYTVWVKTRARNEPLDLAVYNRAAIELLQPDLENMQPYCIGEKIPIGQPNANNKKRRRGTKSSV